MAAENLMGRHLFQNDSLADQAPAEAVSRCACHRTPKRTASIPRFLEGQTAPRCWILLAVALLFLRSFLSSFGAAPANWRIFRAPDGLKDSSATAVSLSPRGSPRNNVWVKHGDASEISVLDGYQIRTIPSPSRDTFRVYESRTGQLWALYEQGLVVHDGSPGGQWVRHPISEIRDEIRDDPLRKVRQIPLVPAERDRVLFLLSDQLMEYDSARRQAAVLKRVEETRLGRFLEMVEGRGEWIWISGAKGLAKVLGQLRHISAETPWQIDLVGERLQVENLQRPFEDDQGIVTTVASDPSSLRHRVLLRFNGAAWSKLPVESENISKAWPGWDQTIWAYTINSLLRFDDWSKPSFTKEHIWVGQYKDIATETNGVFWLATSEGLVRYAAFPWRAPPQAEQLDSLVHAAMEDAEGRLWFASTDSLIGANEKGWKRWPWPEGFEADFQTTDLLYSLPDGRIAIAATEKPLLFDPRTQGFQLVTHPAGRNVRLIGLSKDGKLWAQTSEGDPALAASYHLEQFDGESFALFLQSQPQWRFKGELYFARTTQNGDLWLGGSDGVAVYRQGGVFQAFGRAQGFVEDRAFCLLELGDGRVWCGGGSRILEFNGEKWSVVCSGLERANRMIRSRSGRIWIATAAGMLCFWEGSWVMNGVEEGLPSTTVSEVVEDRLGRLWAATARGISLYHSDADLHPPKTLTPALDSRSRLSTEEPVTLLVNGVDKWQYTLAERLLYSYRLDESQWSPYTNLAAHTLQNLRAGKHRFEVRAMDRNWNKDPEPAFVEFTVITPWYKEARLMMVLICGLALVLFFAWLAVNRHLRSYAEVERIVAQRTRELERANQELLHSQKMRALGTLAAGIAHDFNNILSIIRGSAQIIESHPNDQDKIRTRVNRIKTVVDQGAGIVKSMLGLSRITEQDLVLCDLNALVDDTLKLLGDRLLQEVAVRFAPATPLPAIPAMRDLLQQMLINLALNASDAMMGVGEILFTTGRLEELPSNLALPPADAPSYAYVAVQDTGCGIAPDVLPRIFEPFFTTKALSTRRGTGLGLTMVYELAKQMGYGLKVNSTVGKGSTFVIIIPGRIATDLG